MGSCPYQSRRFHYFFTIALGLAVFVSNKTGAVDRHHFGCVYQEFPCSVFHFSCLLSSLFFLNVEMRCFIYLFNLFTVFPTLLFCCQISDLRYKSIYINLTHQINLSIFIDFRYQSVKAGFYWRRSWSRSRSRKSASDQVKIKNQSRKRGHKLDGIGVGRIRTVPFSSDSSYDSDAYDPVKTRLSES